MHRVRFGIDGARQIIDVQARTYAFRRELVQAAQWTIAARWTKNLPMYRLFGFGPDWVDDDGLRADRIPPGLVALTMGSLSALMGYANRTECWLALCDDPRWHPYMLFTTSSLTALLVQRGYDQPPAGAKFSGIILDSVSVLLAPRAAARAGWRLDARARRSPARPAAAVADVGRRPD